MVSNSGSGRYPASGRCKEASTHGKPETLISYRHLNCPPFDRTVWHGHERLKPVLEDMLMSNDDIRRVEVITGLARRRYWPAHEKLRIIEESLVQGESISAVARRNGVAPNLLFRWRRLLNEGGAMAVGSNEPVVGASEVRRLEDRVRDLERLLGRKTMECAGLRHRFERPCA